MPKSKHWMNARGQALAGGQAVIKTSTAFVSGSISYAVRSGSASGQVTLLLPPIIHAYLVGSSRFATE